jgi:biopolymer transport protein ExbD
MKPLSQMNVIPFIDVMLVLLAVVLTTATFVAEGKIPVALPSANQAEALQDLRSLELTIDASGQVFLAERPLSLAQLDGRLADVGLQDQLRLRVDEATPFRYFVAVVDLLKAHELENLSIVTKQAGAP